MKGIGGMSGMSAKLSHAFTDKKRETFLALVARGYTVTDSAKQIGFSRRAVGYCRVYPICFTPYSLACHSIPAGL